MIMALGVWMMSGCQQVNDLVNKPANTNTAANSNASANANANSNANSNTTANSNANANTSASPTNSAANANTAASNTAANTAVPKEEIPLTEEAKVFKNNLEGKWRIKAAGQDVTFTEDKYEVKRGDTFIDKGSYRVLDEKTVEINSTQQNEKWNATMKIINDGKTLDWQEASGSKFQLDRVE
jgi:hypothetical protein